MQAAVAIVTGPLGGKKKEHYGMWCGRCSVTNSTYRLLLYLNCPLCCYGKENSHQKCVCVCRFWCFLGTDLTLLYSRNGRHSHAMPLKNLPTVNNSHVPNRRPVLVCLTAQHLSAGHLLSGALIPTSVAPSQIAHCRVALTGSDNRFFFLTTSSSSSSSTAWATFLSHANQVHATTFTLRCMSA